MKMSFDVIIASYNRPALLGKCLESIFLEKSEYLKSVLVLTQREDLETIELLNSYQVKLNIDSILVDNKLPPGASRNLLIKKSKADYLHFLDDDAFIPSGYYDTATKFLLSDDFMVIGGPDQSPEESSFSQKTLGKVLESILVMGPTFKRHNTKSKNNTHATEVELTLCNLWIKSEVFKEHDIYFDEKIMRCEENILLDILNEKKFKVVYLPSLFVFHFRRDTLLELAKIQFKSGIFRGISFYKGTKSFKPFLLIPLITGLCLISFPLLFEEVKLLLIFAHMVISIIISIKIMISMKSIKAFLLAWIMVIIIHVFFSIGLSFGAIKGRFQK